MKRMVLATRNPDKLREFAEALRGLPFILVPATDFPDIPEVVEDGKSLEENAVKKAHALSLATGLPAIADDTGLFVDVLGGRPGVHSARYAGPKCSYKDNVGKMLDDLWNIESAKRTAYFRTVIVLASPGAPDVILDGIVKGTIGATPMGNEGFGYDPLFIPEGQKKTFAEMTLTEKDAISHRGIAIRKLRRWLIDHRETT